MTATSANESEHGRGDAMDAELKAHLVAMQRELLDRIETLNANALAHTEQRHREAQTLIEALRAELRLVAEGVSAVSEKVHRVASDHERRLQSLESFGSRLS